MGADGVAGSRHTGVHSRQQEREGTHKDCRLVRLPSVGGR